MYGIFKKRIAAYVCSIAVIAGALAGCDRGAASAGIRQKKDGTLDVKSKMNFAESTPPGRVRGENQMLRYQVDEARSRIWVLTPAGIVLYEASTGEQVAEVPLPGWLWAREQYVCPPDLALGPGGDAVISSNVVPTLWRVDPVTLVVSQHDLILNDDSGKDIGFTGLAFSAQQGAFFAVSALHGSLWRIDALLRTAQSIPLSEPLRRACNLAIPPRAPNQRASRFVGLCVGTDDGTMVVNLAPDQRSGYARPENCRS